MLVTQAAAEDLNEIVELYDAVNDYLSTGVNYPNWSKGMYPNKETAQNGLSEGSLYVLRINGGIAGAVILNHAVPEAYAQGDWAFQAGNNDVLIVHTLAVHPNFLRRGVAEGLMDFAKDLARQKGLQAIRLDTPAGNLPAIALYEKCGYRYAGMVDLRLGIPGLYWFRLYELIV